MNTAKQIIYGRAAYEGFAKVIGSKLGLAIKIDDGTSACIDSGGTIHMPGMNTYQSAHEFAVTCGVIVHELSHQFYKSHKLIDPNRDRLEHDCLNAVLDVADETWIDEWFIRAGNTRPGELLAACNRDAFHKNARGPFGDWNNAATHAWKVLCMGILAARRVPGINRWKRHTARMAASLGVDAKTCFRLIRRAVRSKKQNPTPVRSRFAKLIYLARQLADLLKPFTPPPATPASTPLIMPIDAALAAGQSSKGKGCRVASEQEGAELAETNGAGFAPAPKPREVEFDADAFNLLSPAVSKVAQRIAIDGEGLMTNVGLSSGSCLGQAHRLVTDGQCLARWNVDDSADGVSVSVVLDCSSSMNHHLPVVAGIARAFASSMRQAGAVQTLAFGCKVKESDDFARVADLGGTNTHLALAESVHWLTIRPGRRWVVLITDGNPNDPIATDSKCREAIAQGIHILAIGLACNIRMPEATVVTAWDSAHLAIELDAAAHQIERA